MPFHAGGVVQVYGEDSYMKYYPLLLHSVTPIVASTIYSFLARALNDFEEHPTGVKKKNMLVIKVRQACLDKTHKTDGGANVFASIRSMSTTICLCPDGSKAATGCFCTVFIKGIVSCTLEPDLLPQGLMLVFICGRSVPAFFLNLVPMAACMLYNGSLFLRSRVCRCLRSSS